MDEFLKDVIENKKIMDEFLKDVKKDPIGFAIFWHKSYLVALSFLEEKGLRDEFHKYEEQFDIKNKDNDIRGSKDAL